MLLDAHEEALDYGGLNGIRDEELLHSAITTPYVGYYPHVHDKAAALLRGLACNHGFVDGNKRTANYVTEFFIRKCGYFLKASDEELKSLTMSLVTRNITREAAALWFKERLVKIEP